MDTYSDHQEFNDLLWGTPMPVMVMINGQMTNLRVKGACSVIVVDVNSIQEKAPDAKALVSQVRTILAGAVIDIIIEASRAVSSVGELLSTTEKIANDLPIKAAPAMENIGLQINHLEIHAIEEI